MNILSALGNIIIEPTSENTCIAHAIIAAIKGTIAALLPDRVDRYLNTNLFISVCGKCPL